MTKKKKILIAVCVILGMGAAITAALVGGYKNNEVKYSFAEEVNKTIDDFNEEVSLEGAKMYSSNPYDYKESNYYKQLVGFGMDAVPLMSEKICSGEITGLNQYLVGLAIQDITQTDIAQAVGEGWVSGEQLADVWEKFIQTAPENIEEILETEESADSQIEKLQCYGVFGVAAVQGLKEESSDKALAQISVKDASMKNSDKLEQYAASKSVNVEKVNQCFDQMYNKLN